MLEAVVPELEEPCREEEEESSRGTVVGTAVTSPAAGAEAHLPETAAFPGVAWVVACLRGAREVSVAAWPAQRLAESRRFSSPS